MRSSKQKWVKISVKGTVQQILCASSKASLTKISHQITLNAKDNFTGIDLWKKFEEEESKRMSYKYKQKKINQNQGMQG